MPHENATTCTIQAGWRGPSLLRAKHRISPSVRSARDSSVDRPTTVTAPRISSSKVAPSLIRVVQYGPKRSCSASRSGA